MKVAIIGSRSLTLTDFAPYLPREISEIISGGAKGIDTCAKNYALVNKIKLTEFLPEYDQYGKFAPLKRNLKMIDYADIVIAFWDGHSKGTKYVIEHCKKINKPIKIFNLDSTSLNEITSKRYQP